VKPLVDGDPPWQDRNLPLSRKKVPMGYSQPDDFVDKERAPLFFGLSSLKVGSFFDQRKHLRVSWKAQMVAQELSGDVMTPSFKITAEVLNISEGGMCVVTEIPVEAASVLQCEMKLPGVGIRIPTVMQVTWVAVGDGDKYVMGLRYVI
jgi:hypothetical protein